MKTLYSIMKKAKAMIINFFNLSEQPAFKSDPAFIEDSEITKNYKKEKAMKTFAVCGAAFLNMFYGLFNIATEIFLWMFLPMAAMYFTSYFVPVLGTGIHAEIATIVMYIVAAVAGVRAAIEASAKIRSFKVNF